MHPLAPNPALASQFETQVNFMTELTHRTYDLVRKLSEINMHLAQQMIEDGMKASRELMSSSDPFHFATAAMNQIPPLAEHLRNYQQQLMSVMSGAQADLTRTADAQRAAMYSIDGQRNPS
jgi:hypothetical protein